MQYLEYQFYFTKYQDIKFLRVALTVALILGVIRYTGFVTR